MSDTAPHLPRQPRFSKPLRRGPGAPILWPVLLPVSAALIALLILLFGILASPAPACGQTVCNPAPCSSHGACAPCYCAGMETGPGRCVM